MVSARDNELQVFIVYHIGFFNKVHVRISSYETCYDNELLSHYTIYKFVQTIVMTKNLWQHLKYFLNLINTYLKLRVCYMAGGLV